MKRLFSENKVLFVLAVIIIVCFIAIVVALVGYFYGGNGKDKYGTRLNGIENVKISEDINSKVSDAYKDNEAFNSVKVNVEGKIIYVNIDIKTSMSLVDAQSLALKSLEVFSEEEKGFYDIQLIVTAKTLEEESSLYPIMGYKNSNSAQVIWTNVK